jgi:16S rRNA (cytosine1402-N4)-methyltransferase
MIYHQPVLLNESIEGLNIKKGGIYIDATFGGGGHSNEILKYIGKGSLIAFDQDQDAMKNKLDDQRLTLINQNFRFMRNFLKLFRAVPVDGILADLGISSHQIDESERGFSLRYDAELDLRMNRNKSITAADIVNEYSVTRLREIFYNYGELNNGNKVAIEIDNARIKEKIKTTKQLQEVTRTSAPKGLENKFYAKLFQALRIEVNDELGSLKELFKPGGRLVIISYHSLEDRLVKNFLKAGNFEGSIDKDFYGNPQTYFKLIIRKPIVPGETEINRNSRARSAKLRIAEKI